MRVTLLIALLIAVAGVAVSRADTPARARAQATLATGTLGTFGTASAIGSENSGERFTVDANGVRVGTALTSVRARRAVPAAQASATARSIRLLDGLVTAYGAKRTASATARGVTYGGFVDGLQIGERVIGDVNEPGAYDLPDDSGWVLVNRGGFALQVTLTRARNGFPAGTSVTIASVSASARRAKDTPEATPEPTAEPKAERPDSQGRGERTAKQRARRAARAQRRREDAAAAARLADAGYLFPVFGTGVTLNDDYGAPRQKEIGTHQGNDIFGPFGAPVIAVADGVVDMVGTLDISGNRLWLETDDGDRFFYAHLSSFAPSAVGGRRVKAGTLLGFVGNTGDAEPTPPHLHFEIHPGGGRSIDPHGVLEAWRGNPVPRGGWLARYGGAAPGALVAIEDYIGS